VDEQHRMHQAVVNAGAAGWCYDLVRLDKRGNCLGTDTEPQNKTRKRVATAVPWHGNQKKQHKGGTTRGGGSWLRSKGGEPAGCA